MPKLSDLYKPGQNTRMRLTLLLWGASGCGKTTFAATGPGRKLWLLFDPDGTASIGKFDSVAVWDLTHEPPSVGASFKDTTGSGVKGLAAVLDEAKEAGEPFDTLVFDSLSSFGELALQHGVVDAAKTPKGRGSTIEDPGYSGYGRKNTWVLMAIRTLLRITGKHDMHCIFIGHEGAAEKDSQGNVIEIPMMLGGNLRGLAPVNLSEQWIMEDLNGSRRISVRNKGLRKGAKTRMFRTKGKDVTFVWDYDVDTGKGLQLVDLFNKWQEAEYQHIDLPK